jgi:hypothetical protein
LPEHISYANLNTRGYNQNKNMFRKIVSNLSFSPALVGQLGFYAKRLRKEEATRRLGLIFVALALVVQSLAVFNPPTPANAADTNDLIYGGIRPADGGISIFMKNYDSNINGLRDIMNYFGITRAEIANSKHGAYQNVASLSDTWYSVNHRKTGDSGEQALQTTNTSNNSSMTFYTRPWYRTDNKNPILWGFKGYSAQLAQTTGNGTFYLMDICGNLIIKRIPPPPVPKCTVAGKTNLYATDANCFENCTVSGKTQLAKDNPNCFIPCALIGLSGIPASTTGCTPCTLPGLNTIPASSNQCHEGQLKLSKSAINITDSNIDATTVTAKAGDQISYLLTAKNENGADVAITFNDDLTDSLQYATLIDNGGGTFNSKTQELSWPETTIKAGGSQSRTFTLQMKSEIPATPTGLSDPNSFDCRMINVFGNQTVINVSCPTPKTVENVVTQLPHTGPTENFIFAGVVLAIVTYFYARSRQVNKEVRLIRRDLNAGTI